MNLTPWVHVRLTEQLHSGNNNKKNSKPLSNNSAKTEGKKLQAMKSSRLTVSCFTRNRRAHQEVYFSSLHCRQQQWKKIHHPVVNPVVSGCSCYAQKGTAIARQKKGHTFLGSCTGREKGSTLMQTRTACMCLSARGVQLSSNKKHRHKHAVEIVSLEAKVLSSFHCCTKDPFLLFGE